MLRNENNDNEGLITRKNNVIVNKGITEREGT